MLAPNMLIRDRYLIVQALEGTVYQAIDSLNRNSVVLKQIPLSDHAPDTLAHLERQAKALIALRHPALPSVVDYFVNGDHACLVSEYVLGERQVPRGQPAPLPPEHVLALASQALGALAALHGQQLLHRGVKPQNLILASTGQIYLVDGGLTPLRPQAPAARVGVGLGSSLQFMPPEQVQGAALTPRSDLYSLAATCYFLLTGVLPALAGKRINARLRGQPDPLLPAHECNPQVPAELSQALAQALALDAEQRPASADELRQAFARAERQVPTLVATPEPLAAATESAQRPGALPLLPPVKLPPSASQARPSWMLPAIISAVGFVLLFAVLVLIALRRMGPADPPVVQLATAAAGPTLRPIAVGNVQTTAPPLASPQPTPTSAPEPAQVSSIEPAGLQVGAQPVALTLRGERLSRIRAVQLVSDDGPPVDVALQPGSDDQATLQVVVGATPLNGEFTYWLEIDGARVQGQPVLLRDFIGAKQAAGILVEYRYTDRVAEDQNGVYTALRSEPDPASQPIGRLRNGDTLHVLRDEVAGWYQVRIHSSPDPSQQGTVGWIERWLVENQEVPPKPEPTPTPSVLVFSGRVYSAPTDAAVQCGSAFESSIYGSVEDGRGRGISGARLQVISKDRRNTYRVTTGRGGVFNVPGLGCTSWTVQLLSVPNAPGGMRANSVTVSNLNGGKFTAAEVRFKLQP